MTKPIESATVYFAGDRSVGIPSHSFNVDLWIDPTDYDNGPDKTTGITAIIRNTRQKLHDLYEEIHGDAPSLVMFDFEIQAQNEREADAEFDSEEGERFGA